MNILTTSPAFAQTVALQLIAERVADADSRRAARERRADRRTTRPTDEHPAPRRRGWAVRLLHPAL